MDNVILDMLEWGYLITGDCLSLRDNSGDNSKLADFIKCADQARTPYIDFVMADST